MYSKIIKDRAFSLRRLGKSYNEIVKITEIPKSTLSGWFGKELGMPFDKKAMNDHLSRIRPLAAKMKSKIRLEGLEAVKKYAENEVSMYPVNLVSFQKSILAMLYWAEGSKHEKMSGLKFTNTDPKMIILFLSLLRKCYQIDETKFRVYLQLYYYHPIRKTKKYWANIMNLSEIQFRPVIMKKRSEKRIFRKNFMGICSFYYPSSDIRKEIMATGYAIQSRVVGDNIL